jgi:hypothetical protein
VAEEKNLPLEIGLHQQINAWKVAAVPASLYTWFRRPLPHMLATARRTAHMESGTQKVSERGAHFAQPAAVRVI